MTSKEARENLLILAKEKYCAMGGEVVMQKGETVRVERRMYISLPKGHWTPTSKTWEECLANLEAEVKAQLGDEE